MNLLVTGLWDLGAAWKRKDWRRVLQVQIGPSERIAQGSKVSSCLLGILIKVFFPKGRKTHPGYVPRLGTNETEEHHFPLWNKNRSTHRKVTSSHFLVNGRGLFLSHCPAVTMRCQSSNNWRIQWPWWLCANCTLKNCTHQIGGGCSAHSHLLSLRGHFHRSVSADAGVQVCVRTRLGVSGYISGPEQQWPPSAFPALCITSCNANIALPFCARLCGEIVGDAEFFRARRRKGKPGLRSVREIATILTTAALQSSRETRKPRVPSHVSHGWPCLWNTGWFTFISAWDHVLPAPRITQSPLNTKYSHVFQMPKGSAWITEIFSYEVQLTGRSRSVPTQYIVNSTHAGYQDEELVWRKWYLPFPSIYVQWDNGYFQSVDDPNSRAPPIIP